MLAALGTQIGINWTAGLAERGFHHVVREWNRELSVGSGLLADGLSLALERAVARVTPELEQEKRYLKLQQRDKDAAEALLDSLKALGDNAAIAVSRAAAQAMEEGWDPPVVDWTPDPKSEEGRPTQVTPRDVVQEEARTRHITPGDEAAFWSMLTPRVDEARFDHDSQLVRCLPRRLARA